MKQKLDTPALAEDLYVSGLFRKGHRCAAVLGVPWFVLSAEHGLVSPSTTLPPYDRRLANTTPSYRPARVEQVADQLTAELGSISGKVVEVHAGATYVEPIRRLLTLAGATLVEPLAGLTLGARLAWYDNTLPPEATRQSLPAPDVVEVVARLTDVSTALTPAEFLATGGVGLRSPGLYSWWVDRAGATELSRGLGGTIEPGLVYAGLAGATRSGGRKLRNTLWSRIGPMHLGGRHEFSTFRLSVGSVLAEAWNAEEIDEAQLTTWIHDHLRVITVPVDDADALGGLESAVLDLIDPPLNLAKVQRNSLRSRLSELRKKYNRRADGRRFGTFSRRRKSCGEQSAHAGDVRRRERCFAG